MHCPLFVLTLLSVFFELLPPALAAQSCIFCADLTQTCLHQHPVTMECENFWINDEFDRTKYIHIPPNYANMTNEIFFRFPLKKQRERTFCVYLNYTDNMQDYTIKSCSYGSIVGHSHTCDYYKKIFSDAEDFSCRTCVLTDCNSSKRDLVDAVVVLVVVINLWRVVSDQ